MTIHLPAILGFTRGTWFWPIPIWSMCRYKFCNPTIYVGSWSVCTLFSYLIFSVRIHTRFLTYLIFTLVPDLRLQTRFQISVRRVNKRECQAFLMLLSTRWEGDTNKKTSCKNKKPYWCVLRRVAGWVAGGFHWMMKLIVSQWIIPENSLRKTHQFSPSLGWFRSPTWEIPRCATDADPEAYNAATITV